MMSQFKNAVDLLFDALEQKDPIILPCVNIKNISSLPVLYALKDFLIKRLGSLLEHTT